MRQASACRQRVRPRLTAPAVPAPAAAARALVAPPAAAPSWGCGLHGCGCPMLARMRPQPHQQSRAQLHAAAAALAARSSDGQVQAGWATCRGKRPLNEDTCVCAFQKEEGVEVGTFGVFDGCVRTCRRRNEESRCTVRCGGCCCSAAPLPTAHLP